MPRQPRILIATVVVLSLLMAVVAGCAQTTPATTPAPAPTSPAAVATSAPATTTPAPATTKAATTPVATPAQAAATTKSITNTDGTQVTIPANPKKIAVMRSPIIEFLCAMGAKDLISVVNGETKTATSYGAFVATVYPDLKDLPTADVNSKLNIEELLKYEPDVVITGGTSRLQDIENIRAQTKLPLVVTHLETLDKYMDDVRTLAQVVNQEQRGEEIVKLLQGRLDAVTARVKDIPDEDKVKVYYGCMDVYHAYGANNFEDTQIITAGGVNVAAETTGWAPAVTAEQLIEWNPDVIVVAHHKSDYKVETILNDPNLASIAAVKNKRVYLLPDATWEFMSPNAIFAIEWFGSIFYPEKFKDVDIMADANEFYQALYGIDYMNPEGSGIILAH